MATVLNEKNPASHARLKSKPTPATASGSTALIEAARRGDSQAVAALVSGMGENHLDQVPATSDVSYFHRRQTPDADLP